MSRLIKQIIFGVFYLVIFGGIGYGVYFLAQQASPTCFDNRKNQGEEAIDCGGPCESCAIKNLAAISHSAEYFGLNGSTNVVINFSNPNIEYGAESFTYTLNIYNQNKEKIFSLAKPSFIYPAQVQKTIIEPNLKLDSRLISGQPEVIVSNLKWRPAAEFSEPQTQIRQIKNELSNQLVTVSGLLVNREAGGLSRAVVGALIYKKSSDGQNKLVGVSKTVLQALKPFEERAFKILAPITESLKLSEIESIITTEVQR